jgi:putative lipoprotein
MAASSEVAMRNALFSLPLVAVLAACASPPEAGADASAVRTPVEVSVTYRERILLPPGHVLTVRVEDVSLADAPARVLAEVRQPLEGRGPPYAVTVEVPADEVDPRHTYAARAEIRDPEGALRFTTDTRHVVLTQGAQNKADIILVGVR